MKTIQGVFEAARLELVALFVFVAIAVSATIPIEVHAQAPRFEWVRTAGGTGTDGAQAVATDSDGGVYLVGHLEGQATFGSNVVGTPQGLRPQAFVSKLDRLGNFIWTDTSRGTENSTDNFYLARSVAAGGGALYVAGIYNGVARFGGITLAGGNLRDFFVVKYAADGTAVWARRLGGVGETYAIEYMQSGIALSGDGAIYVTGAFDSTGSFGATNLVSSGASDAYLAKINSGGDTIWATKFGGSHDDSGFSVAADSAGNSYTVIRFFGPANFGGIVLSGHPLNGVADSGRFYESSVGVVKCDSAGNILWAKQESSEYEAPYWGTSKLSVAIDPSGNCFVSGWVVDRNFGAFGVGVNNWSNPSLFVSKYDSAGTRLWRKRIGDGQISNADGDYSANAVGADSEGNCYIAGFFRRTASFGTTNLVSLGDRDIFIAKYDGDGVLLWVNQAGLAFEDAAYGLSLDNNGNLYVAGSFYDSGRFGSTYVKGALFDAFVAKLPPIGPVPPSIFLNLVNQSTQVGSTVHFTISASGAQPLSYQWQFNGTNLVNETNSALTIVDAQLRDEGDYRVVVSNSGGAVTSAVARLTMVPRTTDLVPDGTVVAWGSNQGGQTNVPSGLSNVVAVAGGEEHSIALVGNQGVKAWGLNRFGQLDVPNLEGVAAIASGGWHNLALRGDGSVTAWGYNAFGQINVPPDLTNAIAVAAGRIHSLALRRDGTAVAWGGNYYGQANVPVGLSNVVALAGGGTHSIALRSDGRVVAWGGTGLYDETNVPSTLTNAIAVSAGNGHSLALTADGRVVAWGENDWGQGTVPFPISNAVAVASGDAFNLVLKRDGTVIGWGCCGPVGQTDIPPSLTNVVAIGAGRFHVLAVVGQAPPTILTQPGNQSVVAGSQADFTTYSSGSLPLRYQWQKNGTDIAGATNENLVLTNTQLFSSGDYSVVITNRCGAVTSLVATLTIHFALTTVASGTGTITQSPNEPNYEPNSQVTLTASPPVGFGFLGWSGDANGTDNPLTVTMTSNLVIIANFSGPRLTPLGNLPGAVFDSEANAISADGSTVVGFASTAGPYHAFRWTESTGMADLGSLPGGMSHNRYAYGVSGDGSVVVGYSRYDDNRTDQAFRWTSSEGMVGIGFFPGRFRSYAWGISADGNVIVGSGESSQGGLAFRWTASEGIRGLGTVTGSDFRSIAYSASSNGNLVVGGSDTSGNSDAVIWTAAGGTIKLGHLSNGIAAVAWDISPDGKFVVGADQFGGLEIRSEAFRWSSSGGFRTLGHIAGHLQNFSRLSISADGEVIVGTEGDEAFVWTPGSGMRRLWDALIELGVNPSADGWTQLAAATGVSDDGRFVCGFGQRLGRRQPFRADLLPAEVPLTVLTNGNGSVVRSPDRSNFSANSTVSLTAIPGPGSYFVNWSGDATGSLNPVTVTMTRGKLIAANFATTRFTLLTLGSGRIAKSPDREYYDIGEEVTLSALPGPWHVFTRWSDGSTTNPRVITIRPSNLYSAVFSPTTAVETLTFSNVSRTAPVGMPAIFVDGEFVLTNAVSRLDAATVSMRTTFPNGAIFYTLDGTTPDFGASLYDGPFVLHRSATIHAVAYDPTFRSSWEADPVEVTVEPTFVLNATTAGGGIITVTPNPASYQSNAVVTVVATPAPGWSFLQWLGDAVGANATVAVRVLGRDLCVQALFGRPLGTTVAGGGSVVVDPVAPLYPYGTVVRLTAVPEDGNFFGAWGNAAMSTNNPLFFAVTNANPTVSCVFGPLSAGQVALTVLVNGYGSVTTTPRGHRFPAGQSVRLSAVADVDQEFLGWTGDATSTSTNVTISLTQSKVVTAQFTRRPRLSVGPCLGGWNEDGFQLTVTGEFGGRFSVEHSDNLEDWQPFGSFTNTFGIWQMTDSSDTNGARRFFRATGQP